MSLSAFIVRETAIMPSFRHCVKESRPVASSDKAKKSLKPPMNGVPVMYKEKSAMYSLRILLSNVRKTCASRITQSPYDFRRTKCCHASMQLSLCFGETTKAVVLSFFHSFCKSELLMTACNSLILHFCSCVTNFVIFSSG